MSTRTIVIVVALLAVTVGAHNWASPDRLLDEPTNEFISYNTRTSAVVRDGVLHYVYYAEQSPGDQYNRDVYYTNYDVATQVWSDPVNLSDAPGQSHLPVLVLEEDGDINVFWYDTMVNANFDLYWNRYDATAGQWRGAEPISQDPGRWAVHPVAALDSSGVVHLFWVEANYYNSWLDSFEIFYTTVDDGQLGAVEQLTDVGSDSRWELSLMIDRFDDLHLSWSDDRYDRNSWSVYYRHKPSGGDWGPEIVIDDGQSCDLEIYRDNLFLAYNKAVEPSDHYQTFYTVKPLSAPDDQWGSRFLMTENDTKSRLANLEPSYNGMRLIWLDHLDEYHALYESRIGPYSFSRPERLTDQDGYYSPAVLASDANHSLYQFYHYTPDLDSDRDIFFRIDANPRDPQFDSPDAPPGAGAGTGVQNLRVHPSPVRNDAVISLELAAADEVELAVYDLAGRRVRTLQRGPLAAGRHEIALDAAGMTAGLYLLRVKTANGEELERFVIER
jgi:hypothetical protein